MSPGDVIYIEANSGAVKRVGRCDAYATEFDLEAEEYVPLPKVCASFLEHGFTLGWLFMAHPCQDIPAMVSQKFSVPDATAYIGWVGSHRQ